MRRVLQGSFVCLASLLVVSPVFGQRSARVPRPLPTNFQQSRAFSFPRVTIGTPPFPNIYGRPINPSPFIAPGLTLGQAAYNIATLGRALSNVPPYAMGYNPYLSGVPALYAYPLSTVGNPYLGGYALATSPSGGYGGDGSDGSPASAPSGGVEVSGPLDTPPPHQGIIRLRLPVTWADVSIDGRHIDRMGKRRTYVTPKLTEPRTFTVSATWNANGRTTRIEDKVTVDAGQIRTVDFTSGR